MNMTMSLGSTVKANTASKKEDGSLFEIAYGQDVMAASLFGSVRLHALGQYGRSNAYASVFANVPIVQLSKNMEDGESHVRDTISRSFREPGDAITVAHIESGGSHLDYSMMSANAINNGQKSYSKIGVGSGLAPQGSQLGTNEQPQSAELSEEDADDLLWDKQFSASKAFLLRLHHSILSENESGETLLIG